MSKGAKNTIAALVLWSLLHTYLFLNGYLQRQTEARRNPDAAWFVYQESYDQFFPIDRQSKILTYDVTEYFVYVVVFWVLFFLYQFLNRGNKQSNGNKQMGDAEIEKKRSSK